jgi:hypothetical protein
MPTETRTIVQFETKQPPYEAWRESEKWWVETTKYYGALKPYISKGPRWILVADFPSAQAAARFTGMLGRAESRVTLAHTT